MASKALDLVNQILRRVQWPTVSSIEGDPAGLDVLKVVDLINLVGQELGSFYAYPFLRRTGVIRTLADYTTGTALGTLDSASVAISGTGAAVPQGYIGGIFKFSDSAEQYRIRDITPAGTTVTIEPAFMETTHSAAIAYTVVQDTYSLAADFDRPFDVSNFISLPAGLSPRDPMQLNAQKATSFDTGTPREYTLLWSDAGRWQMVLNPNPDDVIQIKYDYVRAVNTISRDEDELAFPLRMEGAIIDAVVYLIKRDQQNDLQGASLALQDYLRRRTEATRPISTTPRIRLTPSTERRQFETIKMSRWGNYDWGENWDKWVP